MLGNAPHVKEAVLSFSDALRHNVRLDPLLRETIVLAMAVLHGSEYEWGHHVPIARRAGLSDDEIRAIRDDPEMLSTDQKLVLRYAECFDRETVSDELWREMTAKFDPSELSEITMIVGHYAMITRAVSCLRPVLQSQFQGFDLP